MSVNGITSNTYTDTYSNYQQSTSTQETTSTETTAATTTTEVGAVYEPSQAATQTYVPDENLIAKLKADADEKTSQLRSLVETLMSQQGSAIGQTDSIWSFLSSGNFTASAETIAQAQADVAEDGYWGAEQTSDRIIDFATALSGGDPSKIEEMREAFVKGYENATEAWGDTLPELSQQTYDAVMAKFDELAGITTA
ncbi:MAG: hypothetical protein R3Y54_04450 [Eubacteriales bacterium]